MQTTATFVSAWEADKLNFHLISTSYGLDKTWLTFLQWACVNDFSSNDESRHRPVVSKFLSTCRQHVPRYHIMVMISLALSTSYWARMKLRDHKNFKKLRLFNFSEDFQTVFLICFWLFSVFNFENLLGLCFFDTPCIHHVISCSVLIYNKW